MSRRPLLVSLVAWTMIVFSGLEILKNIWLLSSPELKHTMLEEMHAHNVAPVWLQIILLFAMPLLASVSAICMLQAKRWARALFVAVIPANILIAMTIARFRVDMTHVIAPVIAYLLQAYVLYRPRSNDFFNNTSQS